MAFDVTKHTLVPKHTKLSEKEKEVVLNNYKIGAKDLPKILSSDPAITKLGVKPGDVIKVERASRTAGTTTYYRTVVED